MLKLSFLFNVGQNLKGNLYLVLNLSLDLVHPFLKLMMKILMVPKRWVTCTPYDALIIMDGRDGPELQQ